MKAETIVSATARLMVWGRVAAVIVFVGGSGVLAGSAVRSLSEGSEDPARDVLVLATAAAGLMVANSLRSRLLDAAEKIMYLEARERLKAPPVVVVDAPRRWFGD